jgi:Arc/MetJ-type ribon-helix-helix transcriptional regulator
MSSAKLSGVGRGAPKGTGRHKAATRDKVAVTVPRPLLDRARQEVQAGRAESVSALVSEALADKLKSKTLADILEAWDTEYGPPSEEDDTWARRVLGI